MLELVRTFLIKLPGAKERITKYNKERMWLKGTQGSEDLRKVSPSDHHTLCHHPSLSTNHACEQLTVADVATSGSYPSKVSTLKGTFPP